MGIEAYFAMQRGGRPFAMLLKSCVKGVYGATGPVAYFENLEAPHQRVAPAAIPSNIQPRLAWVLERKAHRAGVRPYGEKLVVRRGKIQEPKKAGLPEERYRNTLIKVLLGVERSVCGSQE